MMEWWNVGMLERWNYWMVEWWKDRIMEWWNDGMMKWWNDGMMECWNDGMTLLFFSLDFLGFSKLSKIFRDLVHPRFAWSLVHNAPYSAKHSLNSNITVQMQCTVHNVIYIAQYRVQLNKQCTLQCSVNNTAYSIHVVCHHVASNESYLAICTCRKKNI